jgi:uncharacterized protein DUF3667
VKSQSCPTCAAHVSGRYCSACGEKLLSDADLSVRHFLLHHVPDEVMHWDGKLGRTLRELFLVPGKMAAEWVRGRRQPYLNPLRLYLVIFVAQAFLASIGTAPLTWSERLQRYDTTGVVTYLTAGRASPDSGNAVPSSHLETYSEWLSEAGTLVIVFLVAAALLLILRKYHRRYLEHLTLALNAVTFLLMMMLVGDAITLIAGRGSVSDLVQSYRINAPALLLPFYWVLAIHRFYGTTWVGAVIYAVAITASTLVIAQVLNVLVLLLLSVVV